LGRKLGKRFIATKEFIDAINQYSELTEIPRWRLAAFVNLHPSILSKAINGRTLVEAEALKVKSVAQQINFKGECLQALGNQPA
jgi:hypothetical protein